MDFVQHTIDLAMKNVEEGGRPFATAIIQDNKIIAENPRTWLPRQRTRRLTPKFWP